jgi:mono/diheme cytochrome c family protein
MFNVLRLSLHRGLFAESPQTPTLGSTPQHRHSRRERKNLLPSERAALRLLHGTLPGEAQSYISTPTWNTSEGQSGNLHGMREMRSNLPPRGDSYRGLQMIRLALCALFIASPLFAAEEAPTEFQKNAAKFMTKCGKCHTVGQGDRVGPDLKGITTKRDKDWLIGFVQKPSNYFDTDPIAKELLEKYNGVKMDDLGLSRAEVEGMLEYIEAASAGPVGPKEPEALIPEDPYHKLSMPDEGASVFMPGIGVLIILLALSAVFWQIDFKRGSIVLVLISVGVAYFSIGGRKNHRLLGNQQSYAPKQPIDFSHKQHAGELRIACMYCHHGAEKSDVAGIPSLDICMNCHTAVKKIDGEPSTEIAKLASIWDSRAHR